MELTTLYSSALDRKEIEKHWSQETKKHLNEMILLPCTESTNDYLLSQNCLKPTACLAEQQTKGKGRRGKNWISPPGTNIYYSQSWLFEKNPAELSGLSLAVALSIVKALQTYGVTKPLGIKWPNDIYFSNKKLSGILVETSNLSSDFTLAIIGIGLNTKMTGKHTQTIDQPWTSVEEMHEEVVDRNYLTSLIMNSLIDTLVRFEREGFSTFFQEWKNYDLLRNQKIKLFSSDQVIEGIASGISEQGELLLLGNDGLMKSYLSGEVSVRLA